MSFKQKSLRRMILAAMFLALALVLPFFTGQIPQIGNALCPMHIPVLLCGFFCGPWYALAVGGIAPVLRFVLFGMPPLMPKTIFRPFNIPSASSIRAVSKEHNERKPIPHRGKSGFRRVFFEVLRKISEESQFSSGSSSSRE